MNTGTLPRPAGLLAIVRTGLAVLAGLGVGIGFAFGLGLGLSLGASAAAAAEVRVAVAANFREAALELREHFERASGHTARLSFASSGQLYTQIAQDAPFDVFLSADAERPARLAELGLLAADPGVPFTYAIGRLVLYCADSARALSEDTLRAGKFQRLALANPATAPYGAAAVQTLRALGLYAALEARLVQGQSVAQAYQFVHTGNAELGFVALAQIARDGSGSTWIVPEGLHAPIRQDAALLARGASREAARAFVEFLRGSEARALIERHGYQLPASDRE